MVMIVVLILMIMVMDIIVIMVMDIMPLPVTNQPSFSLPLHLPLQKCCSPVHIILILHSPMVAFVRPMVVPFMVVTHMPSIPAMAEKINFRFNSS